MVTVLPQVIQVRVQPRGTCTYHPLLSFPRGNQQRQKQLRNQKGSRELGIALWHVGRGRPTREERVSELASVSEPHMGLEPGAVFLPGIMQEVQGKVTRGLGALD